MKFPALALSLLAIASDPLAVSGQTTYPCPAAGSSTILPITSSSTSDSTTIIRVPIVTNPSGLCLIIRRSNSTANKQRAPVARSYANRGTWEQSPGLFADGRSGVAVDCDAGGPGVCDVTLPPLEGGMEYVLESHEYETSMDAEAARFLEQVRNMFIH